MRVQDKDSLIPAELVRQMYQTDVKMLSSLSDAISPKVISTDHASFAIKMEYLAGYVTLAALLDSIQTQITDESSAWCLNIDKLVLIEIGHVLAEMHNAGIVHGNLDLHSIMIKMAEPTSSPNHQTGRIRVKIVGFSQGQHSQDIDDKATDIRSLEKEIENRYPVHHTELMSTVIDGYQEQLKWKEEIFERLTISKKLVTQ
jgi:tRNA A-37 threonylcarbamoyl transferase component Bud32